VYYPDNYIPKQVVDYKTLVDSLTNLKNELVDRQHNDLVAREILFKLNSCLFSEYPHR
jgi:hypothetical protein